MPKLSRSALHRSSRQSFALIALMLGTVSLNLLASPEYRRLGIQEESTVDEVLISWIGEEGKMYGIEVDDEILPVFELGEGLEINYALKLEDPNGEVVIFEVGQEESEEPPVNSQQEQENPNGNPIVSVPNGLYANIPNNTQEPNVEGNTEPSSTNTQPTANPGITINPVETWEVK